MIQTRDTPTSFFYVDPPYPESCQGHYSGYSLANFEELLTLLSSIEGKFLLSSYNYDVLADYTARNGWYQQTKEMRVTAAKEAGKMKIEVLTANYPI